MELLNVINVVVSTVAAVAGCCVSYFMLKVRNEMMAMRDDIMQRMDEKLKEFIPRGEHAICQQMLLGQCNGDPWNGSERRNRK